MATKKTDAAKKAVKDEVKKTTKAVKETAAKTEKAVKEEAKNTAKAVKETAAKAEKTVKEAAKASHKRLRQVEFRTQGPDHPILWANSANTPESYYLKFIIFQVIEEK